MIIDIKAKFETPSLYISFIIIEYNKNITKYIDADGKFTEYGELVIKMSELFDLQSKFIKIIYKK